MAVYTRITLDKLRQAAVGFPLAHPDNLVEVGDGIENSTYFFSAQTAAGNRSAFVLTILENTPPEQMHFSAALCAHLADGGLPVPAPVADRHGNRSFNLAGKKALIFPKASGKHPEVVTAEHCRGMGEYLARAHRCGETFAPRLANTRGLPWLRAGQQALAPFLPDADNGLLMQQLAAYGNLLRDDALPKGPIHGDLFRDNALFDGDRLSAVIDFYNACTDWLLLDVAIAVNDWCREDETSRLDGERSRAFLSAYGRIRPFRAAEGQAWGEVLAIAATRFWVSRLMGHHVPELLGGEVKTKDPDVFKTLLLNHHAAVPPLPVQ